MTQSARTQIDRELLRALPTLNAAADMVGVSASTLQRRKDLQFHPRGREHRIPVAEVLRLADYYANRSVMEVADDLVQWAEAHSPEARPQIEQQVDELLEALDQELGDEEALDLDVVLQEAVAFLPRGLGDRLGKAVAAALITSK